MTNIVKGTNVMREESFKTGLGVLLLILILMTTLSGCSPQASPPQELRLAAAVGDWAELPKRVTKILLEDKLGYKVMVRDAAAAASWPALGEGELDIFTDVWYPNQEVYIDDLVPERVKIAGDLTDPTTGVYSNADQGWLIPIWTRDEYEIDSLEDLAVLEPGDALFNSLDMNNDGLIELLGGEAGWSATEINDEKIDHYNEFYNLDMKQIILTHAGGHNELLATIKNMLDAREDVLFYLWTPHHLFAEYVEALTDENGQILWLEDPWGFWGAPEVTDHITGFPGATIYIAYRTGLEIDHPEVVSLLERITMNITDLNAYCYWESITRGGDATAKDKDDYARQWIRNHRAEVDDWLAGP